MPTLKDKPKPAAPDPFVAELQERVRVLEQQVAALAAAQKPEHPNAWIDRIAGRYADDPEYEKAVAAGAAWRKRENARSIRELEQQGLIDADPGQRSPDDAGAAKSRGRKSGAKTR